MYQQDQLSPELVQAILALQQQPGGQRWIDQQLKRSQMLRDQSLSGAPATAPGWGRVGAPNWAGTLANVYAAKKARDLEDDANVRQQNMTAQRQDALRRYFETLSGQRGVYSTSGTPSYMGGEGE